MPGNIAAQMSAKEAAQWSIKYLKSFKTLELNVKGVFQMKIIDLKELFFSSTLLMERKARPRLQPTIAADLADQEHHHATRRPAIF